MTEHLKYLSLANFENSDRKTRKIIANDFIDGLRKYGFAIIEDTIFNADLENQFYESAGQFFNSDQNVKDVYNIPDIFGQRGYTRPLVETAQGASTPDFKEFYQYGRPPLNLYTKDLGYYENPSLENFPMFEKLLVDIYEVLNKVSIQVLEVISLGLDINFNLFKEYVEYGNSILRVLHYFSYNELDTISSDNYKDEPLWAQAHTDINLVTLLIGSTQKGLQIYSEGEWLDFIAKPGQLAMNVGDMLSRMTGNYLPSTMHRVICPDDFQGSRLSAPFFLHPSYNMPLEIQSENFEKYKSQDFDFLLAGEFLDQRLKEIGLK